MSEKKESGGTPSHPYNGKYCQGEGSPSTPKAKPVDPADNKGTKNASKP